MDQATVIDLARKALYTALLIGGPIMLLSMLVGLIISIFQATTQIQEQSLTFIPKIAIVAIVLLIFGPWMMTVMKNFTEDLLLNIQRYIR
ncbi:flagellar biosynthetic protein FliQ [Caldanaerobius fijiensis DSM 17918]|uniref:Flagellar biosynthetic protein FliQ n=1 Tax=Caldanaerobius fijiensis DSM 17918 TaxID=1121256 RepID=A0A1M4XLG2_9THEO|nr:flagellar biosynthesis protein FliQ [Caldanaerobius fijiensis]SHE94276.1 flagellar biosynthetic protein FliQ [Caldanaerobius fijiensis DSM 17918]